MKKIAVTQLRYFVPGLSQSVVNAGRVPVCCQYGCNRLVFPPGCSRGRALSTEVRFDSPQEVTRGKSTWEVLRGWLVFKAFNYNTLVDNSLKLYQISKCVFGTWLTEKLLRATVFGQFAGGVTERDTEEVVGKLAKRNISSIWFFSIERELESQAEFQGQEQFFDGVNQHYLKSIEMSASCNCERPLKFAAVKLTSIVHPHLLNKLNRLLLASEDVFLSLAAPGKNTVDRTVTQEALQKAVPDLKLKGTSSNGKIGIADWTAHFSIAQNLQQFNQLQPMVEDGLVSFSDLEQDQYRRFISRLQAIGECSQETDVCVLVDAEQTYFQQAIEHVAIHLLSKRHNSARPLIYNTLQTYLTQSYDSLLTYLATARYYGFRSGIKVVRGCYMEQERLHAKDQEKGSPIHATKPETDNSYHLALECLMKEAKDNAAHIMVASHNKETVGKALDLMKECGISHDDSRVAFGQLLGMGDHLTYPLASAGHVATKVVPYGRMDDMMPFLSRRANENRGMIRNARDEQLLYFQELKRRIF